MKKEPFLQVSKRRNKARWQERLLIRFIALILAPVSYTHLDVYKRQVYGIPKGCHSCHIQSGNVKGTAGEPTSGNGISCRFPEYENR